MTYKHKTKYYGNFGHIIGASSRMARRRNFWTKGGSLGLIGNIIVGIIGGAIGYWLLGATFGTSVIGQILTGAVGSIILLCHN